MKGEEDVLTPEVRREKAHRHFVSTFGEARGTAMWKDYCKKSGLLPNETKDEVKKKKRAESTDG